MKLGTHQPPPGYPASRGKRPALADPLGDSPHPVPMGTALLLICLVFTALLAHGSTPEVVARYGAIGSGVGILASLLTDFRHGGLRNLIRADLLALLALYFFTLFEFLFPQNDINSMVTAGNTTTAVFACLLGYSGLALGRHLAPIRHKPIEAVFTQSIPRGWLVALFWTCFFVGFFHMLLAVDFDPVELVNYFVAPRFYQPWGRGRYGDWKALLNELGMLLYLLPPIAGVMLAQRKKHSTIHLLFVTLGFLFLLFYGFSSGTRNILHSYLVTFLIAFSFAAPREKKFEVVAVSALGAILLLASTIFMLQFRTIGLANYLADRHRKVESPEQSMFVDYNLCTICRLVEAFPKHYGYLGLEIPYLAIIRPIPRAIWPDKPMGMSVSIEEVVGAGEEMTVAASLIGEAYMMGGFAAIFVTCGAFGWIAAWWNRFASLRTSEFGILIYASGFFSIVISMRSLSVFTTAILPTIASIFAGLFILRKLDARKQVAALQRVRQQRLER